MKLILSRTVIAFTLLICLIVPTYAAPPTLAMSPGSNDTQPLQSEIKINDPQELSLLYTGDPPTKLSLVVLTPDGETVTVPGKATPDPHTENGFSVIWPYTPTESGTYRYHFEAQAGDFGSVRFPDTPEKDFQFIVANPYIKYLVLGIGLLICLLFLPFVSYTATRSLNRYGDPAAAARISLLIGLVAFVGLAICVFLPGIDYRKWLGYALAGIVILAILVGLFTRRRAV